MNIKERLASLQKKMESSISRGVSYGKVREYEIQLNGYKNYIENKYNKPTNIYLYSINLDHFKKLD